MGVSGQGSPPEVCSRNGAPLITLVDRDGVTAPRTFHRGRNTGRLHDHYFLAGEIIAAGPLDSRSEPVRSKKHIRARGTIGIYRQNLGIRDID